MLTSSSGVASSVDREVCKVFGELILATVDVVSWRVCTTACQGQYREERVCEEQYGTALAKRNTGQRSRTTWNRSYNDCIS